MESENSLKIEFNTPCPILGMPKETIAGKSHNDFKYTNFGVFKSPISILCF